MKLNNKTYNVPSAYRVEVTTNGKTKSMLLRCEREQYYKDKYGDSEHVDLNILISASEGIEVELKEVSVNEKGLIAEGNDITVCVPRATKVKAPKKVKETIEVETAEIETATEDPQESE